MVLRISAALVFIAVTIVCSIVSIPASLIDRSGHLFCVVARAWARMFHSIFDLKLEVSGLEHLASDEHYIYCANHSSYVDVPTVIAAIPKDMRLVMRKSLTRIPIWGWSMLASPYIILERASPTKARRTLQKAIETIRKGANVLLFADGTRTHDGTLQPLKRGAFHIAHESGLSVIPLYIGGTYDVLNRREYLPKMHRNIRVCIGAPIAVNPEIKSSREREIDLMKRTASVIESLAAKAGL